MNQRQNLICSFGQKRFYVLIYVCYSALSKIKNFLTFIFTYCCQKYAPLQVYIGSIYQLATQEGNDSIYMLNPSTMASLGKQENSL